MYADLDQRRTADDATGAADPQDGPVGQPAGGEPRHRGDGGPQLPLLAAKLAVAPLPNAMVQRARLLRRLDAGAAGPLTLVSAPAGWGRTTLLSSWVRDRCRDTPLAWLSVEPGDSGARLWPYLRAALSRGFDGPLPAPEGEPDEAFLIQFADALARRPQPVTLVLDDLHRVEDPAVFHGLDFLLGHASGRLRLVVGSRTDLPLPTHRWRLRDELTEIGPADLAFSTAEAAELFARHGVTLPVDHVAELHARTEGWPVGLRLAALSLPEQPDPARFVQRYAGDHPDVAAYLAEEVLAALSAQARDALVRAAVAPCFSAGLLNAVTGRTDGDRLLAEAAREGFVQPVGARSSFYRCHRMLGELLRADLHSQAPEKVRDLHRRAANWYAGQDLPAAALRHALSAEEWGQGVEVLTRHWRDLAADGSADIGGEPAPAPPAEAIDADPRIALACAADRLRSPDPHAPDEYLRLADSHADRVDDRPEFTAMLAALRLVRAERDGVGADLLDPARHLLDLVPGDSPAGDDPGARAIARTALGAAALAEGDLGTAEAELAAGRRDAEQAELAKVMLACTSRLALVHALAGGLHAAVGTARTALAVLPDTGPADHAPAYLALALVSLHRDQLDDAEANVTLATPERGDPFAVALAELIRAQLRHDRGDLHGSYQALLAGRRSTVVPPHLAPGFTAVEAGLHTSRGEFSRARDLLAPLVDAEPVAPLSVALARTLLHSGDPRGAIRVLPLWDGDVAGRCPLPVRLEAGMLDALAARQLGDQRGAARTLERVLQLAEPEGFRRVFTRSGPAVRDLLAAHLDSGTAYWPMVSELIAVSPAPQPAAAPPVTAEPLTDRELTVLRYLQSILSNVEIASELSLSVNTVKTHVRNIYRKLDATRRREAVRRARELHLL